MTAVLTPSGGLRWGDYDSRSSADSWTALADGIAELSDPGITRALYALVVIASDLTSFPNVAFAAATGLVILRTNALPKWLGWLSLAVGVNGLIRGWL